MLIRRALLLFVLAAVAGVAGFLATPPAEVEAVGPGDVIGEYVVRLKGQGFDRHATTGRVSEGGVRGRAVLTVSRSADGGDPRDLRIRISLPNALDGSILDRATPTPTFDGRGVLVGDSLTVIGAGQSNFVNALTLRFLRKGKKVEGWWIASFPGNDATSGFVAGIGLTFKGKQLRASKTVPASASLLVR